MSLKDNFNQAVKEILRKDGLVGDDLSKEAKKKTELDRYIEPAASAESIPDIAEVSAAEAAAAAAPEREFDMPAEAIPEPEPIRASIPESAPAAAPSGSPYVQSAQSAAQFGARPAYPPPQGSQAGAGQSSQFSGGAPFGGIPPIPPAGGGGTVPPAFSGGESDSPYYETEETTIISRNTMISGNIRSFANLSVDGSVKGDINITKNISVTGKVVGDIACSNSVMTGASMQGNISSKGQVQLDRDTILLGDISAQYLDLNGKIKGNIDIGGKAEFKTDAIVMGNITASTITVLDGATIQGYVNTTFLQESTSTIFPDAIAVSE